MGTIAIQDLHPTGHELFNDNESYLRDLSSDESLASGGLKIISRDCIYTSRVTSMPGSPYIP
jgi:hypothetical protein